MHITTINFWLSLEDLTPSANSKLYDAFNWSPRTSLLGPSCVLEETAISS